MIERVVDKLVAELTEQLRAKGVVLTLTPPARRWLAENGYDERNGARPMARLIDRSIRRRLADELLFGKLRHGGSIRVGEKDGDLSLDIENETTVVGVAEPVA